MKIHFKIIGNAKFLNSIGFFMFAHFRPTFIFIPPENIRKPQMMFSRGIEREHWLEMC